MLKTYLQGRPASTLVEAFVDRHLSDLAKAGLDEKETARLRNGLTFLKMKELCLRAGLASAHLRLADSDYYDRELHERAVFLGSPVETLCKTMVMENTAFQTDLAGPHYPRFICTVVQYCATLNSDKMMKAVREWHQTHCPEKKASRSAFNFRVCEESESDRLSGYGHNGVTPLFFAEPVPVFVAKAIEDVGVGYLWLGGGDTDIKLRVSLAELREKAGVEVVVADISNPKK